MQRTLIKQFSNFILHKELPLCIKCVHFICDVTNYPYDTLPNDAVSGKCKLFGKKNMVTGEIDNNYAIDCRNLENKCGENGKYFTKRSLK